MVCVLCSRCGLQQDPMPTPEESNAKVGIHNVQVAKRPLLLALITLCFSSGALAQVYYGVGIGQGDYSKYTLEDAEVSSLTITKREVKPTGFDLFIGKDMGGGLAYELGYSNLGITKTSGNISGAYADAEESARVLTGSALFRHRVGRVTPYLRLGLGLSHNESSTIKSGNASSVFSNAQNEYKSYTALRPVYGFGGEIDISDKMGIRLDHFVIHDAEVDWINNIDNGYIRRPYKYTSIALVYRPDGKGDTTQLLNTGMKWSIGFSGGLSSTRAQITPGSYSGNNWNLQTGGQYADVSGAMANDRDDRFYRLELIGETQNYLYEFYISSIGEFKAKSATRGLTGGGNSISGSASRTLTVLGSGIGRKFLIGNNERTTISPKFGLALVGVRDEIYNNLDFTGVGGTKRGPVEEKFLVTPTLGAELSHKLSLNTSVVLGAEYFFETGNSETLGKGSTTTFGVGVRREF